LLSSAALTARAPRRAEVRGLGASAPPLVRRNARILLPALARGGAWRDATQRGAAPPAASAAALRVWQLQRLLRLALCERCAPALTHSCA
jgi:hypothetical protein